MWQPIETAPRNGTKLYIVWPGACCAPLVSWQCFEGGEEDGTGSIWMWSLEDDTLLVGQMDAGWIGFEEDPEPTHWMPAL